MTPRDSTPPAEGDLGYWRAEAARLAAENAALVAKLAADSAARQARIAELEAQVAALSEKVAVLAKLAFGSSSEKKGRSRSGTETPGAGDGDGDGDPASPRERGRGQQAGSPGHGRRDYSTLPTEEEIHDVAEAERVCPRCGAAYAPFGQESCEQIDWEAQP